MQAEVHSVLGDGSVSLHARSAKYGKLENGCLVIVPPALVKRLKQHMVALPCGIDATIGVNGYIWITDTLTPEQLRSAGVKDSYHVPGTEDLEAADAGIVEAIERRRRIAAERIHTVDARERMARVHNAIGILRQAFLPVSPETIMHIYNASITRGFRVNSMLDPAVADELTAER